MNILNIQYLDKKRV